MARNSSGKAAAKAAKSALSAKKTTAKKTTAKKAAAKASRSAAGGTLSHTGRRPASVARDELGAHRVVAPKIPAAPLPTPHRLPARAAARPAVRLRLTLPQSHYDTRQMAAALTALDRLYLSVARSYGLGYERPRVTFRSGSIHVDLFSQAQAVQAGLIGLMAVLGGKKLPQALSLYENVKAQRSEYLLRHEQAELERERIARERQALKDVAGGGIIRELQQP